VEGLAILIAVALLYAVVLAHGVPEAEARAMAFASVVIGNITLILANRSRRLTLADSFRRPNPALWWVVAGALVSLALALYVPAMREIFRFAPLNVFQLLASATVVVAGFAALALSNAIHRYAGSRAKRFRQAA
jgi:Ca2+-transporting ATPase